MKTLFLLTIIVISQLATGGLFLSAWASSPIDYARLTEDRDEWAEVVQSFLDEDFEEAARLAKSLTSEIPDFNFLKGFLAYQTRNYAEALEEFGKIQENVTSLRELTLFYMALCSKEVGNLPQTDALFHQIFQEYEGSALMLLYQQTLLEQLIILGKYQMALHFVEHLDPRKNSPFHVWLQHTEAELYEHLNQPDKAFDRYLQLWIEYPLDAVGRSDQHWRRLALQVGKRPEPEQFFARIKNIMKKRRYDKALEELDAMRGISIELDNLMEETWHLLKGECFYESRQDEFAIEHLQKIENRKLLPEALYYLQLTYFRWTEQPEYAQLFEQTAAKLITYPQEKSKTWREKSLQKLAKHFEVDPPVDYSRSIEVSQQLIDDHPNSSCVPEAKWKIAWLHYLQGDYQDALQGLEQVDQELTKNPHGQWELIPQVKYWKGRTLAMLGNNEEAAKVYQELSNTYPFHYYGYLSRLRLQESQPPVTGKEAFPDISSLTDDTLKKYEQFKKLILLDFYNYAETVLQHLANTAPKKERAWLAYEVARFYAFMHKPDQAIKTIAGSQLYYDFIHRQSQNPPPSELYEIYYPQLYHDLIVTEANKHAIPDPLLVQAMILHESLYDRNAVSARGAIGLMQIMPELLEQYRQESGENDLEVADLFDPSVNIRIGCDILGQNIKEFQYLIPALLSYNADIEKVKQWKPYDPDLPFDVYIEQVPFIQTQSFFKRIYATYCDYLRVCGGGENVLNNYRLSITGKLDEETIPNESGTTLQSDVSRSFSAYTPAETLLSVNIQGIENDVIPVNATFDVTWNSDGSIPPHDEKVYEFIVFSMPDTVRFKGEGFLILPPETKLPFGFNLDPTLLRVVFPVYLMDDKTQGTFQVRSLAAGAFTLKWMYVAVNESGEILFSSSDTLKNNQSYTCDVQDLHPQIVVQDRVGMEQPEKVVLSPSKAYELRIFKDRFQVLYAATGNLLFERAGTSPNFSPSSRFLGYFPETRKAPEAEEAFPSIEFLDLLSQEVIFRDRTFQVAAWTKNDSFLIIGYSDWGSIQVIIPLLDVSDRNEKRVDSVAEYSGGEEKHYHHSAEVIGEMGFGCHACHAWEYSQLAIDLENAFVCFRNAGVNEIHSLINRDKKWTEGDEEYPALLQSLGFPIPRTPPKVWEIVEGFQITHIGSEEKGMRHFFSPPLPEQRRFPIQFASIEKSAQSIRGSSLHRGTVYRFKKEQSENEAISRNIIARLRDIEILMQGNYTPIKQSGWMSTRPEIGGKSLDGMFHLFEENYKEGNSVESKVIDTIKMHYPAFQDLTYTQLFHKNSSCLMDTLPRWHRVNYQVWQNMDNAQFLLIQTDCNLGAATSIEHAGDLYVFSAIDGQYRQICLTQKESLSNYLYLGIARGMVRNELKSFLSEDNMLLIADIDDFSIIVFDAFKHRIQAVFSDIFDTLDLHSLHLSENGRFCLQINQGGRFYLYDILTQQRSLSGLYVDDELVLYTDDGFYDGTSEGARYVTWHYPGLQQHFDFSQFESQFKRPDIIKSILMGQHEQKPVIQVIPPPSVNMTLNHPGNYSKTATIELSATSTLPLTKIRLFVNGVPVMEVPVSGKQARKTLSIDLTHGKHWITAVAYNEQGYSSTPQSLMVDASQVKTQGGNLYVVGVGVDHYPNMPKANLAYAKRDIAAFVEAMQANPAQQYEHVFTEQLLDTDATAANIQRVLEDIIRQATVDDTIMLYFAGHGERGKDEVFYFLTSEASFADFETSGLPWNIVAELLNQTKAKVITFLDACHSGVASQDTVVPNDEYVAELMKAGRAGMAVMAASKGRQYSFEYADLGGGHGVFNYVITQALTTDRQSTDTNQNGIIELSELYQSVKANVHKRTQGKQTPWLSRNEIIGEMPLL